MANRVTVNVNVRDHTRAELANLRRQFSRLGGDLNRLIGRRTNINLDAMNDSLRRSSAALQRMRGLIPDDEFDRLNRRLIMTDRILSRGLQGLNRGTLNALRAQIRDIDEDFDRINRNANVRFRPVITPPSPTRTRNSFLRSLTTPFRAIGGILGGTLSGGIGQGITRGIHAAGPVLGPIIAATLTAAVAGALAVVGAGLAGALVTLIGGAFVALGVVSASQSDEVQRNWKVAVEKIKGHFSTVGDGLIKPVHRAIHTIEDAVDQMAPHIRDALAGSAPFVETFFENVIKGFTRLAKTASKPLEEGFNTFLAAFGPDLEDMLAGLGDSLGALGRTVRDHSTEISMALTGILGLVTTLVDIINFFANAWVTAIHSSAAGVGFVLQAWALLVDAVLSGAERILGGLEKAFSPIPGMGAIFAKAKADLSAYKDSAVADANTMGERFRSLGERMDHANRKRKLEVDITTLTARLELARADLKKTAGTKAEAKVRASIAQLESELARARGQLNAINGTTAVTFVETRYFSNTRPGPHAGGYVFGKATGGVIGRAATGGVRNNMTLVGEQGPELVDLPTGSHVRSNPDSRRMMGGGGGGNGEPIQVNLVVDGKTLARVLFDPLRGEIKDKGGVKSLGRI